MKKLQVALSLVFSWTVSFLVERPNGRSFSTGPSVFSVLDLFPGSLIQWLLLTPGLYISLVGGHSRVCMCLNRSMKLMVSGHPEKQVQRTSCLDVAIRDMETMGLALQVLLPVPSSTSQNLDFRIAPVNSISSAMLTKCGPLLVIHSVVGEASILSRKIRSSSLNRNPTFTALFLINFSKQILLFSTLIIIKL